MKLLLNDKEIINFLVNSIDHLTFAKQIEYDDRETAEQIYNWQEKKNSNKKFDPIAAQRKLKDKIENAVKNDTKNYKNKVNEIIGARKLHYREIIRKNIKFFINKFGEDTILNLYKKSQATGFIKNTGLHIEPNADLAFRRNYKNYQEDCLFRNTNGNESLLVNKIDNNFPFWFIDSGYTNFLEGKQKKWHRLTRNHIHHVQDFEAPVDRLGNFKEFPKKWRTDGEFILVIEPGPFSAAIFHVDINEWKLNIETEIRKYTDKPIKFRPKIDKKARSPLYKELLNEDYYCVININSNAATESVWAGVPAITLGRHISNSVTRNKLSDINNLYRGPLASWLAMLSYSQFTYDELIDGTAVNIVRKYYG